MKGSAAAEVSGRDRAVGEGEKQFRDAYGTFS
jgi:hypothetical protein